MAEVDAYEAQQLESLRKRRKTGAYIPSQPEAPIPDRTIALNEESGLELRTCLGVLWPADSYENKFGRKPTAKQMTTIKQGGQQITGVLLPQSDGMGPGCTEVFDVKKSTASSVTTAATSDTALNEQEVDGAWNRLRDSRALSVGSKQDAEAGDVFGLQGVKRKAADDFDDLLDFSNTSFSFEGILGESGNFQAKEVQTSERCVLEAQQMLTNLQNTETLQMVKSKQLSALSDKLKARLSTALVHLYTQGYNPTENSPPTPGMKVLETLREMQASLEAVAPLVSALGNDASTGRQIWDEASKAKGSHFVPPANLAEIALSRDINAAAKAADVTALKKLLGATADEGNFNAMLITNEEARKAFLDREVMRLVAELLREENKVLAVRDLLDTVLGSKLLPDGSDIKLELEKLMPVLRPMDLNMLSNDELKNRIAEFRTNRDLRLHKCLNNFATGITILKLAAEALEARTKDVALEEQLAEVVRSVAEEVLPTQSDVDLMNSTAEKLGNAFDKIAEIRHAASAEFCVRSNDKFTQVSDKLKVQGRDSNHMQVFASFVRASASALAVGELQQIFTWAKEIMQMAQSNGDADDLAKMIKEAEQSCGKVVTGIVEPCDLMLARVMEIEDLKEPREFLENFSNLAKIIAANLTTLAKASVVDGSEDFQALVELLEKPTENTKSLTGFEGFHEVAKGRVQFLFEASLVSMLKPLMKAPWMKQVIERICLMVSSVSVDLCPADPVDFRTEEFAAARAKAESFQKAFGACKGRNLSTAVAALAELEIPDGKSVPLWLLCCLPRLWQVVAEVKGIAQLKNELEGVNTREITYEDFASKALKVQTMADKLLCSLRKLEEPDKDTGLKIMVVQVTESLTVDGLKRFASELIACVAKRLEECEAKIKEIMEADGLKNLKEKLQSCDNMTSLSELLPTAQSQDTKNLHAQVKSLERLKENTKAVTPLSALAPANLTVDSDLYLSCRTLVCELAAIQGLCRPLKQDENRGELARRARLMIVTKGDVTVEKNLDLLLNKVAAESGSNRAR
ncbi:unnamed protein product [Symbiodinium sp. CCMP2592]|nr:unnamed protein product [Symbiodinium sp. CCMP2592]